MAKLFSEAARPCEKGNDQEVTICGSTLQSWDRVISKMVFHVAELISETTNRYWDGISRIQIGAAPGTQTSTEGIP